jgi:hypothetical protein
MEAAVLRIQLASIPGPSTGPAARCVGGGRGADPLRSPGRGRVPSTASRFALALPEAPAAFLTSVQGRASSERRTPPRRRGPASCSRPASPRGRVEGRGHTSAAGTRACCPRARRVPAMARASAPGPACTVTSKDWTEVEQAGLDDGEQARLQRTASEPRSGAGSSGGPNGAQISFRAPARSTREKPNSSPKVVSMRRRKAS